MKDVKILGQKNTKAEAGKKVDLKHRSESDRTEIRKREHKALMKSLTMA